VEAGRNSNQKLHFIFELTKGHSKQQPAWRTVPGTPEFTVSNLALALECRIASLQASSSKQRQDRPHL
jgi:hypothetical protein